MMFSVESKACFEWKFHRNRDEKNDLLGVTDSNYFLFISSFFNLLARTFKSLSVCCTSCEWKKFVSLDSKEKVFAKLFGRLISMTVTFM